MDGRAADFGRAAAIDVPGLSGSIDLAANLPGSAALAQADALGRKREDATANVRYLATRWAEQKRAESAAARDAYRREHPVRAFWRRLLRRTDSAEAAIAHGWQEIMARVPAVSVAERNYRVGAEGERATGAELSRLPRAWHVLHSVPVGAKGADIDHVVLGPGGVFTLNTKHHRGASIWVGGDAFKVGGVWTRYVEKARYEADRAAALLSEATGLSVPVTPVIVLVGARRVTIKEPPRGVEVVQLSSLVGWFARQPAIIRRPAADRLFQVARNSTVWTGSPGAAA